MSDGKPTLQVIDGKDEGAGGQAVTTGEASGEVAVLPAVKIPEAPDHLDEIAQAKWRDLAPVLVQADLLTVIDDGTLELFCVAYAEYRHCQLKITEEGRTYISRSRGGGTMRRLQPEVGYMDAMMKQMRALAGELGLSPAARKRITDRTQLELNLGGRKKSKRRFFRGGEG